MTLEKFKIFEKYAFRYNILVSNSRRNKCKSQLNLSLDDDNDEKVDSLFSKPHLSLENSDKI